MKQATKGFDEETQQMIDQAAAKQTNEAKAAAIKLAAEQAEASKASLTKKAEEAREKAFADKVEDAKILSQKESTQSGYKVLPVDGYQLNLNKPVVAIGLPAPGAAVMAHSGVIEKTEVKSTISVNRQVSQSK